MNKIAEFIWNRCAYEAWCVGIKARETGRFHLLTPTPIYWYADPIIRKINNRAYVFMEAYNKWNGTGCIAVSEVRRNHLSRPKICLKETFHLSFPEIFKYNETFYLIPETHSVSELRIYKMGSSVTEWKLVKSIHTVYAFSDTVVYVENGFIYLITTEQKSDNPYMNRLHVFVIENFEGDSQMQIRELLLNPGESDYGYSVRNGGSLLNENGQLIRVTQESSYKFYGKSISFKRIIEMDQECYLEEDLNRKIELDDIHYKMSCIHRPLGVHTYGRCEEYEVIDIKTDSMSVATVYSNLRKKFRR